jgi:hypothetical protein
MPSSESSRDVVLERLAAEFVERHRRGECPPLGEYTERYPDLASDIRDLFPALVQIEQLKPASDITGAFESAAVSSDGRTLERLGEYSTSAWSAAAAWASSMKRSRNRWEGTSR